jgi:3-hexulose-6-phosphate synthase
VKIQLALDRISIDKAIKIIGEATPYIDIIEVGTALIKDFGMTSVKKIKKSFPDKILLADIKTMDEGAYEFNAAFSNGADIATVMAAASLDTIAACYKVADELNKTMMIDLLEVDDEKIHKLKKFSNAIFCVHLASDNKHSSLTSLIKNFKEKFPEIKNIAVAGGVSYDNIKEIKEASADIVIIGGAITKSADIKENAKKFREMI